MKRMRQLLALLMSLMIFTGNAAAFDTSRNSNLLLLVNKTHSISEDYVPELVELSGLSSVSNGIRLRGEAADALYTMFAAMEADGVKVCNVISGYRSYAYQLQLVTEKVEKRVANGQSREYAYEQVTMSTAPAGCSEHQMGLAIDFSASTASSVYFGGTAAGAWLKEHAWEYGFILRYQEVKTGFTGIVSEPWHYRYVGLPHSMILRENGWCYEEYISYLHEHGYYAITVGDTSYQIFWTEDTAAEYENILDISADNDGGWIITTGIVEEPLSKVAGHWSESSFLALQERGVTFNRKIDPQRPITRGEFAALCGLAAPENFNAPLIRQDAAKLLESTLPDKSLTYLVYEDIDAISGSAFQSVQMCVTNGIFSHAEGLSFRPADQMTWAEAAATALRYLQAVDTVEAEEETSGEDVVEEIDPEQETDEENTTPAE